MLCVPDIDPPPDDPSVPALTVPAVTVTSVSDVGLLVGPTDVITELSLVRVSSSPQATGTAPRSTSKAGFKRSEICIDLRH